MEKFRASRALLGRTLAVGGLATLLLAAPAHAAEAAPGEAAFKQARSAWERGAFETAEPLYREALEKGGLSPTEVLEGYVRLGAIRASLGKKDQAVRAFKAAAILDASFSVPSQAGPKGPALAEKARRETVKIGSIQLSIKAPKETPVGKTFKVTATLDRAHIAIVNSVGLYAKDGTTGKEVSTSAPPDETMELEVPSDVTLPGASILVRVDALDAHQNRLASTEERVHVPDTGGSKGAGAIAGGGGSGSSGSNASSSANTIATPFTPPSSSDSGHKGGFWSSPWPYIVGAVVIAGAGTAVYFGTRPPADVSVGQVGVRER